MAKKNWQDIGSVKERHAGKIQEQQARTQWQQNQQQPQYLAPQPALPDDPRLIYQDPRANKTFYSPNYQYTQATDSGLLIRQKHNTVWLNGDPAARNVQAQQVKPAFATLKDAADGRANWSDVETTQREQVLSDPKFYESGQINRYPVWQQQQILADPNFKWDKLPKWQKYYFELSSSPAGMGAVQGGLLGLPAGGGVGAAIGAGVGATLGWAAGKSGYNPAREAWEQKGVTAQAFGWANFLAEQAEKTIGMGVQAAQAATTEGLTLKDVFTREGWEAGAVTFETLAPAMSAAFKGNGKLDWGDLLKLAPPVWIAERMTDLMLHPEKYKGEELVLGSADPLELESTWKERMDEARDRIRKGDDYREVALDFQNGVLAQLGDMAGQAIVDPLNVMPTATTKGAGAIADVTGNTVAATALKQSGGLVEAGRTYKTLVQTGQAQIIDPNFRVDRMGAISRFVAGVNADGSIKAGPFSKRGLLDAAPPKTGFLEEMTSLTPQARAQIGANMFYENIGALLTRFDDPHEAGKYLKALSNSDMETWAQLGSKFADSPEFYTVLPALKAYNAQALDAIVQAWDLSQPNRDALTRIADVLGDNPSKLLDDLAAKGTAEQDYQRLVTRLEQAGTPEARLILDDIQAGRFTVDTLKQIVDVFTGEGALPWHPGQWKAMMLDSLGTHFDEWVSERLMLDQTPEAKSAFFRTAALAKTAQSILLLGGSPGYAITNGLSNMVHRAASGVFGYLTPTTISNWMERFGVNPARFEEGVGIGGMVEQATTQTGVRSEAQAKAVRGTGHLADARDRLSRLSKGMPFSKLSSWFEKNEGRQAFTIAMRGFWSQSWRRGVGFRPMDARLTGALQSLGVDPGYIYAAIEAGMNQAEIEKILTGRFEGVQSRALINNAAQKLGIPASQAAEMLDKIGVLDTLDKYLKGQGTRDGVDAAFKRAERIAQDWLDMQAGEDLKATAEHVKQKVGLEGAAAGLDVTQRAQMNYWDAWMEHYGRLGEVFDTLTGLEDPDMLSKAIEAAYDVSDREFRRINATTAAHYKGIFDAWGLAGDQDANNVLSAIGQSDMAMKLAYEQMREIRRRLFAELKNMTDEERRAAWGSANEQIDGIFQRAFDAKNLAEKQMGEALGKLYENRYGPAAGEAARRWWNDVIKFNQDIVKRERKARAEFKKLPLEERAAAKARYYGEEKIALIAEAERINADGLGRLDRVVKRGGGRPAAGPTDPTPPTTPGAPPVEEFTVGQKKRKKTLTEEEVEFLTQAAEERKAASTAESRAREESTWDIAEQFNRESLPYQRNTLNDKYALLGALRKEEYGGIPDLKGLTDERLTPEIVRRVLERRAEVKAGQVEQTVGEAVKQIKKNTPRIGDNTTILKAISELGGIKTEYIKDITGDAKSRGAPGVFTKKGLGLDEMARQLEGYGYPINLDDVNDPGGIQQTTDLINRAINKEKIYPAGHDFDAEIEARARQWVEEQLALAEAAKVDPDEWQADYDKAMQAGDLTRMYELIGEAPEGTRPDGETWVDYVVRTSEETADRITRQAQDETIAETAARNELAMEQAENAADYAMSRNILKEKFQDVFGLTDEQAQAYMELSDAIAGWYERVTGESGENFYSRYYNDVVREAAGDGELYQFDVDKIAEELRPQITQKNVTYRGISAEQYAEFQRTGRLTSDGRYMRREAGKPGDLHVTDDLSQAIAHAGDGGVVLVIDRNRSKRTGGFRDIRRIKGDVIEAGDVYQSFPIGPGSLQQGIQVRNQTMSPEAYADYARALVRAGTDELRRAVRNETDTAGRIALLNAAHEINPAMAVDVARKTSDVLFQTVYHGSPYKFDKFTLDKIGSGEGVQAYGWGLYFAGDKGIAEWYRKTLTPRELYIDGQSWRSHPDMTADQIDALGTLYSVREKTIDDAIRVIRDQANMAWRSREARDLWNQRANIIESMRERIDVREGTGQLYAVDIPDDGYLLWDQPIDQQPKLQEFVRSLDTAARNRIQELFEDRPFTGGGLYEVLKEIYGTPKGASMALKEAGFAGIQYLDGTSRAAGKGSYNFVIFDDEAVRVLETYYQAGPFGSTNAAGAVSFDADGIKATIHAFEAADISTLIHENGHVFRRVLSDVAARSDDAQVKADLATIENWVGAEPGKKWTRAQEEQFARGFERYITEGEAPTPALVRAFESFKTWMLEIYQLITGSAIDVKLTPEVKEVFGRMLGAEDVLYQKKRSPGQIDMFAQGEDLPLFSGTAQRAQAEEFTPQAQPRQETLFDMRPQMGDDLKAKIKEKRRQIIPTESPEFKRWFKNSKVVDESGRPMVVYHGTTADFTSFDINQFGKGDDGFFGKGFYFGPAEDAGRYAGAGEGANVMPVYLKMENPLRINKDTDVNMDWVSLRMENVDEFTKRLKAEGYDGIIYEGTRASNGKLEIQYFVIDNKQIKSTANRGTFNPNNPDILFQEARHPTGATDEASQYIPHGQVMDEGYRQHIKPLLEAMRDGAVEQVQQRPLDGAFKDMTPEGQAQLQQYLKQVQNDMATTKLATVRYGEQQRDFAMLNYGKQYGFDRWLNVVYPYQLFYTRSLATWAARGLDAPAWFSNYARLRMQQQRYERDIPERLRNKIKIPAPWLPDWMGDGLYIDPLGSLFTPANFLRPFERMQQDKNYQEIEAERILQEWAQDGTVSQGEIERAIGREGPAWERALAEAKMRRESEIANPMDFFSTMFGPAWYLSTPLNLAGIEVPGISKGDQGKVSTLPLTNTARAIDTVTQGTWAEPIGNVIGLIGKPEEWARKKLELPTLGEYGEYYTKRQVANMVAEGLIDSEQAQLAMLEKQGAIWEQATERVKMELALRVPTAGALYAALHDEKGEGTAFNIKGLGQASLPTLFGSGLLPEGELEYRGLKEEWNDAWKKKEMGDTQAVTRFFEEHPEYEAYLAKGKGDDELLKSFLIGQIWDGYMEMGPTNQKQARAEMGELFQQAFLDKETRSYESIDTETLIQWARMFGQKTPEATGAQPLTPEMQQPPPALDLYNEDVTRVTDEFFRQRSEYHADYFELEQGYYNLPKSQRARYLMENPGLKEYWDFKDKWYGTYPDLEPIFRGQVFKRVDTTAWPPGLVDYVTTYAYTGKRLPKGAYKALEQQWIMEGRPYDDMKVWLSAQVVPAMLYGGE